MSKELMRQEESVKELAKRASLKKMRNRSHLWITQKTRKTKQETMQKRRRVNEFEHEMVNIKYLSLNLAN